MGDVIGGMFGGSSSETSSSQRSTSNPTFGHMEGLEDFAQILLGNARSSAQAGSPYKDDAYDFLSSLMGGEPMDFQINPALQNSLNSIREQADMVLPDELASARSRYVRGPAGRSAMAIDETLSNNRIRRDANINNLLASQYNQDVSNRANAANNLIRSQNADLNQNLQLLSLLSGREGTQVGSSSSEGSSFGQGLTNLGRLGSAASGILSIF